MDYSINSGAWRSVFAVPSSVVDDYIKLAGENALKLLLFLLRNPEKSFSEKQLCEALGFRHEGEAEDAADFWIQRGILKGDDGRLVPDARAAKSENYRQEDAETSAKKTAQIRPAAYSPSEIAARMEQDKEFRDLYQGVEQLLGRPLLPSQSQICASLLDHYGLSAPSALMLYSYCRRKNETAANYIYTLAQDWAENGIITAELANARVLQMERHDSLCERLRRAMGMNSKLTKKMTDYVKNWEKLGYGEDMIMLAYEMTVDNLGEWNTTGSAAYCNRIIENWKAAQVYDVKTAKNMSEEFTRQNRAEKEKTARKKAERSPAASAGKEKQDDMMLKILNSYEDKV